MKPEVRKYLEDIRSSIDEIELYVKTRGGFNEYLSDRPSQLMAERLLIVIGEQIGRILRIEPEIGISDTKKVMGFRNRVVHDYDLIDNAMVFSILTRSLPVLKEEVQRLLQIAPER